MDKKEFMKLLLGMLGDEESNELLFKEYFKKVWYLVDEDGYSVILLYYPEICIIYEDRRTKGFHVEYIDKFNFKEDLNTFLNDVNMKFGDSLEGFKDRILNETEEVILKHFISYN